MKRLLFPLLLFGLFSSCYHEVKIEPEKPGRLLLEDSMVIVLTETQLADGALTLLKYNHAQKSKEKERYYAYIYKKFNLTPEILKKNIEYYNADPEKMIAIYDRVLEKLSVMQAEYSLKLKKLEKEKQDSINSIDTTFFVKKSLPPFPINQDNKPPWDTAWLTK